MMESSLNKLGNSNQSELIEFPHLGASDESGAPYLGMNSTSSHNPSLFNGVNDQIEFPYESSPYPMIRPRPNKDVDGAEDQTIQEKYGKEVEEIFEIRKITLKELLEKKFRELEIALQSKKGQLLEEIDSLNDLQGVPSLGNLQLNEQSTLESFLDVGGQAKLNCIYLTNSIEVISKELDKNLTTLNKEMFTSLDGLHLSTSSLEALKKNCIKEINRQLVFESDQFLVFKTSLDRLDVSLSPVAEKTHIPISVLARIKEISLDLSSYVQEIDIIKVRLMLDCLGDCLEDVGFVRFKLPLTGINLNDLAYITRFQYWAKRPEKIKCEIVDPIPARIQDMEAMFADVLKNMEQLRHLNLNLGKTKIVFSSLKELIKNNMFTIRNLDILDVSLVTEQLPNNEISELLFLLKELKQLRLSIKEEETGGFLNLIGESKVSALEKPNILELISKQISMTTITEFLKTLNRMTSIKIDFSELRIADSQMEGFTRVLETLTELKYFHLCLKSSQVTRKSLCAVFNTLPTGIETLDLDFSHTIFSNKNDVAFVEGEIPKFPFMAWLIKLTLNLNKTSFTNDSIESILISIPSVTNLTLKLEDNNISNDVLQTTGAKVVLMKSLKQFTLTLDNNQNITDEGIKQLFLHLPRVQILFLSLKGTKVSLDSLKQLKSSLAQMKFLETFELNFQNTQILDEPATKALSGLGVIENGTWKH